MQFISVITSAPPHRILQASDPRGWGPLVQTGGVEETLLHSTCAGSWVPFHVAEHLHFLPHASFQSLGHLLGFPGGSDGKESACKSRDSGVIPGWGRSPAGGHGNPLPYPCLENPVDRGAWRGYRPRGRQESDTTEQRSTHMRPFRIFSPPFVTFTPVPFHFLPLSSFLFEPSTLGGYFYLLNKQGYLYTEKRRHIV